MDSRALVGVDIVHDLEDFPWPLADQSVVTVRAHHVLEHVLPRKFIGVMDEMHRVLVLGGEAWISTPYGLSHGFVQDPTHTKPVNEDTFAYFTPTARVGVLSGLYAIYRPRPWAWVSCAYEPNANLDVVLRTIDPADVPKELRAE